MIQQICDLILEEATARFKTGRYQNMNAAIYEVQLLVMSEVISVMREFNEGEENGTSED